MNSNDAREKVSVVIPCYCSEPTIAKVVNLTREAILECGFDYEFVLVNDCSKDGTFDQIELLAAEDPKVVGIDCAKNLGQHSAIICGLNHVSGDYVMLMDDDMQTHPSQCHKLINAIVETGDDVVFAKWTEHKEAAWRRLGSNFATWSMRVMTKRPKEIYSSNFFIMRRHVADQVTAYKGPFVYIQGLVFQSTSRVSNVMVEHFEREQGQSGYTLKTLVRLWSTILNFSMMPLRASSIVGTVIGLIGLLSGIGVVVNKVMNPEMAAGWPSLMAALLFCSGVVLISLGLIGEYLGRVFMTVNNSPQYVARKVIDRRQSAR